MKVLDRAMDHLIKSLDIYIEIKDIGGQSDVNWDMGNVSHLMKKYDNTISYFKNTPITTGKLYWG